MPARRHGREQGNAAHMVGRDRREGAAFLREGKSKYFCKGGCSYFLRRKRKKINKPQPQPFCLKPPGCGAKRAVPGRAARRHVPAPGRPGAARPWGESSFILTDKRAKRPPHHPTAREASASLEGVFQGKPSTGLFPPGGKCRGWPPEKWVRCGARALCGTPHCALWLPDGTGAHHGFFMSCEVHGWQSWGAGMEPQETPPPPCTPQAHRDSHPPLGSRCSPRTPKHAKGCRIPKSLKSSFHSASSRQCDQIMHVPQVCVCHPI